MSLERNNEDEQTEQQSDQRAYYSREKLRRDAQRIHNQSNHTSTSKAQETEQQAETPVPEIDQINMMIRDLAQQSGATSAEAKRDERVTLLAAATLQMCQLLKNYSSTTNAAMEKIAERELQNLNVQKQYAESVEESTVRIARGIYHQFVGEQKQAFKAVTKYLSDTNDEMEKSINECTKEVRKATNSAAQSAERLRKIKTIGDLLYFAAPLLVLIDIILRVVALAAHFP